MNVMNIKMNIDMNMLSYMNMNIDERDNWIWMNMDEHGLCMEDIYITYPYDMDEHGLSL